MQCERLNVRIFFMRREIYFVLSEAGRFPRGPAFSLFYCTDQDESLLTLDANGDGAKDLLCYSFSEERYSLLFNRFVSTWWAPPSRGESLYSFQPLEGLRVTEVAALKFEQLFQICNHCWSFKQWFAKLCLVICEIHIRSQNPDTICDDFGWCLARNNGGSRSGVWGAVKWKDAKFNLFAYEQSRSP